MIKNSKCTKSQRLQHFSTLPLPSYSHGATGPYSSLTIGKAVRQPNTQDAYPTPANSLLKIHYYLPSNMKAELISPLGQK